MLPTDLDLAATCRPHEVALLAPSYQPQLARIAPYPARGPAIVFVHGIGGDPGNQARLVQAAQARGMRTHVMLYETWRSGAAQNAAGFAAELRALAAAGDDDLTLVAHSLGAITAKGALDQLRRPDGHLEGFARVSFIALGAPWAGVTAADLARHILTGVRGLAFARDLAPGSAFWRGIMETPLAPEVAFYSLTGTWDSFNLLTWHPAGHAAKAGLLAQARRHATLPRGTHNAPNWDGRAIAFVFDPDAAPDPATLPPPSGWKMAWREAAATLGQAWAFQAPD